VGKGKRHRSSRLGYRAEMRAARARLSSLALSTVSTPFGVIRYADRGEGPPVLVVHGITQGTDGGFDLLVKPWVPQGFRLIVPSRFGYLGSDLPPRATPEMQADAFDSLLEELDVHRVVVLAASAGSTSALQFALRHPDRTTGVVLISPNVPGPHQGKGPPRFLLELLFSHDRLLWAFQTLLPGVMAVLIGVPTGLRMTAEDRATVATAMHGVFPARPRVRGVVFDAYESNPRVAAIPFSEITVPTLILHAKDDPGPPYAGAEEMARDIPGARLLTIERGGHLMLGDHRWATKEVADFLRSHGRGRDPSGGRGRSGSPKPGGR
jgi:pimeloyl-ACP methyl ester carboxylesterase